MGEATKCRDPLLDEETRERLILGDDAVAQLSEGAKKVRHRLLGTWAIVAAVYAAAFAYWAHSAGYY